MTSKRSNIAWLAIEVVLAFWFFTSGHLLLVALAGIMMVADLCGYEWKTNPERYPDTISSTPDVWVSTIILIPFLAALILLFI